jgi:hypothetical protein
MENIFGIFMSAAFGAIFGSYATLFAYRLPLKESCFGRFFGPKSRCPYCDHIIKTRDLIPLLNWLFTLGKCRNCEGIIPKTHLFIELATTITFVISFLKFGFSEEFILYSLMGVSLIILAACNYNHKIFPSELLIFLLILALLNRVLTDGNLINLIFSGAIGVVLVSIFNVYFYQKAKDVFDNINKDKKDRRFDYIKFLLIGAVTFSVYDFLVFMLIIMISVTLLMILNYFHERKINFGYILITVYFLSIFN